MSIQRFPAGEPEPEWIMKMILSPALHALLLWGFEDPVRLEVVKRLCSGYVCRRH